MDNSTIKILLVDDEPDILEFMEYNLKKEGYQVLLAGNGKEAVDIAKREKPQLVILDIMMPGMDGFQFLEAFENLPTCTQQHCRVIMLSTSESFKDLNRANKNRFVKKFLNKPLTSETINAIHV